MYTFLLFLLFIVRRRQLPVHAAALQLVHF